MATRTDGDTDTVGVFGNVLGIWGCLVLRFVELEADLRQIIEFGDGTAFDFRGNTSFEDAVE